MNHSVRQQCQQCTVCKRMALVGGQGGLVGEALVGTEFLMYDEIVTRTPDQLADILLEAAKKIQNVTDEAKLNSTFSTNAVYAQDKPYLAIVLITWAQKVLNDNSSVKAWIPGDLLGLVKSAKAKAGIGKVNPKDKASGKDKAIDFIAGRISATMK